MHVSKNDYVVCIDDNSPLIADKDKAVLKLGELYRVLDVNIYGTPGLRILRVQNINTGETDWFHADRFTLAKRDK